jgi:ribose-phosphate pyrophosphokinase
MSAGPLLFCTAAYETLAARMAASGELERGLVERRTFPDGEHYLRVATAVDGRDIALVGGTGTDAEVLELYDLACTLVDGGAHSLSLVVPYFGCSTMERAVRAGEAVTAKTRARLLSSIPAAHLGNRVFLLDLHSEGIPFYFEGPLRATHVYAKRVVGEAARRLGGADFVLACTDAGRAKWVESLANDLGVDASFVFKRRLSGDRTEVSAVSAQVQGRHVVIYDDMIRTGSSLIGAASAYRAAGARAVSVVSTHGVFPGDALGKLRRSGLFDKIVVTDSHPRALELQDGFLETISVAPLLVEQLSSRPV